VIIIMSKTNDYDTQYSYSVFTHIVIHIDIEFDIHFKYMIIITIMMM